MKKIISILLMLSMVFSLVACSTEPASDVVDNADVSGEVSEAVSDKDTDVTNVSTDELTEHELEFIDILINTDWQSIAYTEDYESWIDSTVILIDFNEDFTLTYTDENGTNEGEWTYEGYDAESEDYFVKLYINGEEFGAYRSLESEFMIISSHDRKFAIDFLGVGLDDNSDEVSVTYTIADTVWTNTKIEYSDGSYEYFEDDFRFEFTSGTEAILKFKYGSEYSIVSIDTDLSSITSEDYYFDEVNQEFNLSSDYFVSRNNDGSNTAKATISNNELRIVTNNQTFVFEYSGVSGLEITNEMVIPLYSVTSTEYTQGTGSTGVSKTSIPIYMDYIDSPYTITLKTDGTAELSHGESIIEGDWYYENLLVGGPYFIEVDIFISANLFTYEGNEEFFAPLIEEARQDYAEFNMLHDDADEYIGHASGEFFTVYTEYNSYSFDVSKGTGSWIN